MKTYNEEVKVLMDLKYRYANIVCHGGYGNNPDVIMLSRTSTIFRGFIKNVDSKVIGKDANGEYQFEKTLYIDSEYGHEIKLPYEKIIGIDILSSEEQAFLENYNRNKETWKSEIERMIQAKKDFESNDTGLIKLFDDSIRGYRNSLKRGEELIEKGVKTFK